MTYKVVLTASAKQDLRTAYLWAAVRAPHTAVWWLSRFEAELQSLDHFPDRYSLAPENNLVEPEIREMLFGRRQGAFRVLFTIAGNEVHVLHIRRACRDWATAYDLNA